MKTTKKRAEKQLSVVERRLDEFSVEDAASALWGLGALGYTVCLKVWSCRTAV